MAGCDRGLVAASVRRVPLDWLQAPVASPVPPRGSWGWKFAVYQGLPEEPEAGEEPGRFRMGSEPGRGHYEVQQREAVAGERQHVAAAGLAKALGTRRLCADLAGDGGEGHHGDREVVQRAGWAEDQKVAEDGPNQLDAEVEEAAAAEAALQEVHRGDPIVRQVVPGSCAGGCPEVLGAGSLAGPALEDGCAAS